MSFRLDPHARFAELRLLLLLALLLPLGCATYTTSEGLEPKLIGSFEQFHDVQVFQAKANPGRCFQEGLEGACLFSVKVHVNVLRDSVLAIVPDTLRVRGAGVDTLLKLDTIPRYWPGNPPWAWSGTRLTDLEPGPQTAGYGTALNLGNLAGRAGDTLTVEFKARVLWPGGGADTLRVFSKYRLEAFRERYPSSGL
jgi:hypothetical protein